MMYGKVNRNCEATLSIAVGYGNLPKQMIETVIDTGFTGFLSLPSSVIASLSLPWSFRDYATLGDGSQTIFDMYTATVIWNGEIKHIDVAESETEPLIGMSLLYGFKLEIEAVENGLVIIKALTD